MNKSKSFFEILLVLIVFSFGFFLTSCSKKSEPEEEASAKIEVQVPPTTGVEESKETQITVEKAASEPNSQTKETYKGKLLTRDFVHSLDDIKYFPAATILLTDKWYTKKPSIKICERIVQLPISHNKENEFVTYWLVQKKKPSSDESNCDYLMNVYNYDEANKELQRLFKDKLENKNIVKRVYGKVKIRGPYIVIYDDEKRDTDLIIDLNRLGTNATEYFIENWDVILATVENRGSLENPGAAIHAALKEDKHLRDLDRKDLMDNLVLWTKAGVCVGLVAASVTTTTVVGDGVIKFITTSDTMFKEAKDGKLKNKSYCAAISEIANQ